MRFILILPFFFIAFTIHADEVEPAPMMHGQVYSNEYASEVLSAQVWKDNEILMHIDEDALGNFARESADQVAKSVDYLAQHRDSSNSQASQAHYLYVTKSLFYLELFDHPELVMEPGFKRFAVRNARIFYKLIALQFALFVYAKEPVAGLTGLAFTFGLTFVYDIVKPALLGKSLKKHFYDVFWKHLAKAHDWKIATRSEASKIASLRKRIEAAIGKPVNHCEVLMLSQNVF